MARARRLVAGPATGPTLPPPVIGNLTSTPGDERYASPSPDGTQVAFAWNGSSEDNTDIYIKTSAPKRHCD